MLNFLKFQFIKSLVAVRSVVMVAGICSSVGGIVFLTCHSRAGGEYRLVSKLRLLIDIRQPLAVSVVL